MSLSLLTFTLPLSPLHHRRPPPQPPLLRLHSLHHRHPLLLRRRPLLAALDGAIQPENERFSENVTVSDRVTTFFERLRTVFPGGRWWRLSEEEVDVVLAAKPVTVWNALHRMWQLVASDRWVIFSAFSALILTALSEISIPHFLTASIFSAQSGKVMIFRRNVVLLVVFCITSGICRSKSLAYGEDFSALQI